MEAVLFIIGIIIGSGVLTFLVVKGISKIELSKLKPSFPKINFPDFRWRKKDYTQRYRNIAESNWFTRLYKKQEPELNYDEYDLEEIFVNGERVPRLVPKKPKEEKGGMPLPLTKNFLLMAGVVVVGALVGYYVMKKMKK